MKTRNLFKALLTVAVSGLFASAASSAFASDDTADLRVTGTIVPGACEANFAGNGLIDFGSVNWMNFEEDDYAFLPFGNATLNVTCPSARTLSFTIEDPLYDTALLERGFMALLAVRSRVEVFGFGAIGEGDNRVSLGGYSVGPHPVNFPTVDGDAYRVLYQRSATEWSDLPGPERRFDHAGTPYTLGKVGAGAAPVAGRAFVMPLRVSAALNREALLQLPAEVKLNGQAVFSIVYQ